MARPKSTNPIKEPLNLTVSKQTKLELRYIAAQTGSSISSLVAEWAAKEAKKLSKAAGQPMPDGNQLSIDDLEQKGDE